MQGKREGMKDAGLLGTFLRREEVILKSEESVGEETFISPAYQGWQLPFRGQAGQEQLLTQKASVIWPWNITRNASGKVIRET